jgi:hypothetical protein
MSGWPKLSTVTDCHTHLFRSAVATRGPGHDAGQFRAAVGAAAGRWPIDTLLGDRAFDGENLHAHARRDLGIRATVFPVFRRGGGTGPVGGEYRNQMARRFRPKPAGSRHKRVYGQRWQAERAFSRHKRQLGSALRSRRWSNQAGEILLRAVVHNLMLLAA